MDACLRIWDDLVKEGIDAEEVPVIACPGEDHPTAEILLARAMEARVAWLDPAAEADAVLADTLPMGADGVLELPPDAMTLRALFRWTRAPEEIREELARCLHADYRRKQRRRKPAGDPALAPWERLLPALQRSNLHQADDIPNKLALIGKRLAKPGGRLQLGDEEVETLAEVEHGRYVLERLTSGWQLGERNVSRLESHDLVPWDELDEKTKDYDREAVRNLDSALAAVRWGVADI